MIKKLLLTVLLSITTFAYEIIIDKSITKSELFPNGELVLIKSGSFMMGSNSGDSDEKPVHKVSIPYDFYMGKYEVTFAEYDEFCDETNRAKPDDNGWGRGDKPVINVSWYDAKAYTKWLSKKTSQNYRLPTEAEWEYAARAGTTTKYSFSNSSSQLSSYAWYSSNSNSKTHKVGLKKPNRWGLYDMHGNVWEWCDDLYDDSYNNTYKNGKAFDRGDKKYKILCGGSWNDVSSSLRSANRFRYYPSVTDDSFGFRVVRIP